MREGGRAVSGEGGRVMSEGSTGDGKEQYTRVIHKSDRQEGKRCDLLMTGDWSSSSRHRTISSQYWDTPEWRARHTSPRMPTHTIHT